MLPLYSLALLIALVISAPVWLWRMATQGKYRAGLKQRLGRIPQALHQTVKEKKVIWLHAVSVGEVLAASRLITDLELALPNHAIVISTTTNTGQALAQKKFGAARTFYLPLDFTTLINRYLRALKPELLILMESEFWPNLIAAAARRGTPIAVANARISDRSLPRYLALRKLWQPILTPIALFCAQSPQDAQRLQQLGIPKEKIQTPGNLKFDTTTPTPSPLLNLLRAHLPPSEGRHPERSEGSPLPPTHLNRSTPFQPLSSTTSTEGRPPSSTPPNFVIPTVAEGPAFKPGVATNAEGTPNLIIAGSTLENEEAQLITAFKKLNSNAVLLIAPRHPERFNSVASLTKMTRLSTWRESPTPIPPNSILLLDTIGDLASLYSIASLAFIGGSLINAGGHNPLEPAQFAVPVLIGPHYQNFRSIVETLIAAEAITITTPETLAANLTTPNTQQGINAQKVFASQSGSTARTITALLELIKEDRN